MSLTFHIRYFASIPIDDADVLRSFEIVRSRAAFLLYGTRKRFRAMCPPSGAPSAGSCHIQLAMLRAVVIRILLLFLAVSSISIYLYISHILYSLYYPLGERTRCMERLRPGYSRTPSFVKNSEIIVGTFAKRSNFGPSLKSTSNKRTGIFFRVGYAPRGETWSGSRCEIDELRKAVSTSN